MQKKSQAAKPAGHRPAAKKKRGRSQQQTRFYAVCAALGAVLLGLVLWLTVSLPDNSASAAPEPLIADSGDVPDNGGAQLNNEASPVNAFTQAPVNLALAATAQITAEPTPEPTPTPVPTPTPIPTPTPVPTPTPKPVKLKYPFEIEVDKAQQIVTVYTLDADGYYKQIVKQFICSTGHCDKVEDGWYRLGDKYRWKQMGNGSYAQYASRISGPYLFHSACYYEAKINKLKVRYYEKLGTNASSGCIRLECKNAYWIYNNCPEGTPVHVISGGERDETLIESLKPDPLINANYDPTDPEAPERYRYTPSPDATPDPTPYPGVTPAPTPGWTVHPVLKAWGYC